MLHARNRRLLMGPEAGINKILAAALLAAVAVLSARPASAFELDGHQTIEAAAYKRLLALDAVPGTGPPPVSGRALLASLIATGVLFEPPCFDRLHPRGDCGARQRLELPLEYWPPLHSGGADLVIDRQIGQRGQCQHFMAQTADSVSPVDPRFGAPGALVTTAYSRCVQVAGVVFDGILRDPYLASWRVVGTYVLMHAIEDSFSAAHVDRDPHFNVVHLLSWTLIDWPSYWLHGHASFPPASHHAVSDKRDYDYVRWDAHARDGTSCRDFHEPYAVPEECLTERAQAAVGAVVDYLVITYRLRARAVAEGRPATLFSAASDEAPELWLGFLRTHLPSVAVPAELPAERYEALPRADVFVGVQGNGSGNSLGVGLWGGRLFYGPATPFALAVVGGAGWSRSDGVGQLGAGARLGLLLPIVRRFTIGVAPAGLQVSCTTHLGGCQPDLTATLGELLVPLGTSTWLGVEGPRWSWTTRAFEGPWAGLALGWSHESGPHPDPPGPEAAATWNPPRPDEVTAFRQARSTRAVYLATTVASRADNAFVGVGLDWARDRDRWDRRAGFAPSLQVEVDAGAIEGTQRGGAISVAGSLRAYVLPDRLALTATPALVRVGAIADRAVGVDVAGSLGILFDVGRIAVGASSPPLSYLSRERWHALPFTIRLGLRLD
jgi:hypothetical protein